MVVPVLAGFDPQAVEKALCLSEIDGKRTAAGKPSAGTTAFIFKLCIKCGTEQGDVGIVYEDKYLSMPSTPSMRQKKSEMASISLLEK